MMRTSILTTLLLPSGSTSFSCSTRSSGLQAERHVADLVEKERAAVGQLELADARLPVGTRIGAGRGAEAFGFEQGLRDRRDIEADEGMVRP